MKYFKLFISFILGIAIGVGMIILITYLFTDISITDAITKTTNIKTSKLLFSFLLSLVSLFLSIFLQITLHEGGHLICGLATGYKFVSFRIGSFTLIKEKGHFRLKRYSIAGTGGQCLLTPPDREGKDIPYFWYNAGGVLMNMLTGVTSLYIWLALANSNNLLEQLFLYLFILGILFALLNGIPMKISGITNDGYNILLVRKDIKSREYMAFQLQINAENQKGVRLKDMPNSWFYEDTDKVIDYHNTLQISMIAILASRHIDCYEFEKAHVLLNDLMQHKNEMPLLFQKEIACELLFTELTRECRKEIIEELYTKELEKYVQQFKNTMSSKQRLLCALALNYEKQPEKANRIYQELLKNQHKYLLKGEVTSDMEIMKIILR